MKNRAYAKINLSLDILGLDDRNYHTLESIFLPINFYDEIEINKANEMRYSSNKDYLVFDDSNTIVKAINLLKDEFNIKDNFEIHLNKHIPTQAGLGGGSSDGACIIRMINNMYNLHLSAEKIKELCEKIGSDVLFCYYSKPAFVSGTGEKIEFIDVKDDYYVLLLKPKKGVSTKLCYEMLDMNNLEHKSVKNLKEALKDGQNIEGSLINALEKPAMELNNQIKKAKDLLIDEGFNNVLMSGSGSCVFAISKDKDAIEKAYINLKEKQFFIRKTSIKK